MNTVDVKDEIAIKPEMTVLDVVAKYGSAERVFKAYDEKAGVCICCQALFEPLKDLAENYGLDLDRLIADLESAASDQ